MSSRAVLLAGTVVLGLATNVGAEKVTARLHLDDSVRAGTDGAGRVLMYAPDPVQSGSSISHWDTSATPSLLMEPTNSSGLPGGQVDLTTALLRDLGWPAGSSTITLRFTDPAGSGFNDATLGDARKAAIRRVADIWQALLASSVEINAEVRFQMLACAEGSGVLAQAAPQFLFMEPSSPFPDSWYPGALAESLSGMNRSLEDVGDPNAGDLRITFNDRIDQGCLGSGSRFNYNLSGNVPLGQVSFVNVALHEMAHGLGFVTFTNTQSGQSFLGSPDVYSHFLRDNSTGKHWHQMTPAEIQASAKNGPHVVWTGPLVIDQAPAFLGPAPSVLIQAPASIAGRYPVGTASFGPALTTKGVTGDLVLFNDGSAQPTLACNPAQNAAALAGKIALIDRSQCDFDVKVKHAENAGAKAVIIANHLPGLLSMGGDDTTVVIPSVLVSKVDGDRFKAALASKPPPPPPPDPPETEPPSQCSPANTKLCLTPGRFRVEVSWRTQTGETGSGQAVLLTSDTGYFWFFSAANVELVIKVLNACKNFDRFWVFAGGLTNVEVDLTVVDTKTGKIRRYHNPLNTPLRPIQDTNAFSTCP